MDRHDLQGESAEDVATAHARDLEVQDTYGVSFLSYWFDEASGSAFCLARASGADEMETVHRESHGLIPNEIIPVSEDAVLQFLGEVHNPANESEVTSAFRTILFTDIEGSTALAEKLESAKFVELLNEHDLIVRRALFASRGREIKHTGDGIMASFDEVSDALECALAIREGFRARNETSSTPLGVRIGLAAGEPVDRDGDLFGPTVNLASRLCSASEPDSVLVSEDVHELGSSIGFAFTELDRRSLKGFAEPVRAFEFHGAASDREVVQRRRSRRPRR
jgi:class 3 adenylate cyclase